MGSIVQDENNWPLVRVTMTGEITSDEMNKWFPTFLNLTKRQQPFAAIFDMRKGDSPSKEVSGAIKAYMDKERPALRKFVSGAVIVISSSAVRVGLNALLLLVRPPYPTKVVNTMEEAEKICEGMLKAHMRASA